MNIRGAKAKGRRLVQHLKDLLVNEHAFEEHDVRITPSSETGRDISFHGNAFIRFPFAVEAKNQEKLNIWSALEQAESHVESDRSTKEYPMLIFGRNRTEPYVAMKLSDFLEHFKP